MAWIVIRHRCGHRQSRQVYGVAAMRVRAATQLSLELCSNCARELVHADEGSVLTPNRPGPGNRPDRRDA